MNTSVLQQGQRGESGRIRKRDHVADKKTHKNPLIFLGIAQRCLGNGICQLLLIWDSHLIAGIRVNFLEHLIEGRLTLRLIIHLLDNTHSHISILQLTNRRVSALKFCLLESVLRSRNLPDLPVPAPPLGKI